MQTFLPDPNFFRSAMCLDYKRLGKQRVEVKQLLLALGVPVGSNEPPARSGWANHPAAKMWKGHEKALALYGVIMCTEWRLRGYNDTLLDQFLTISPTDDVPMPPWMGNAEFHRSHQSNLLRKDPDHYAKYWPGVPNNLEYIWP